jgi:hypothetical protein
MKKRLLIVLLAVFFVSLPSFAVEFWASKHSRLYHYPECEWAKKIKAADLIIFSSPQDAVNAGYIPCKLCAPPESSLSAGKERNAGGAASYSSLSPYDNRSENQPAY